MKQWFIFSFGFFGCQCILQLIFKWMVTEDSRKMIISQVSFRWIFSVFFGWLCCFFYSYSFLLPSLVVCIWISMAFFLSITDYFYRLVDPYLFYPFTFLLWGIAWYHQITFHWFTFIAMLIFCLFFATYFPTQLGLGDLLLLLVWAPWLSWSQFVFLLLVASSSALSCFGWFYLQRKPRKSLPFVPFLSLGLTAALFLY